MSSERIKAAFQQRQSFGNVSMQLDQTSWTSAALPSGKRRSGSNTGTTDQSNRLQKIESLDYSAYKVDQNAQDSGSSSTLQNTQSTRLQSKTSTVVSRMPQRSQRNDDQNNISKKNKAHIVTTQSSKQQQSDRKSKQSHTTENPSLKRRQIRQIQGASATFKQNKLSPTVTKQQIQSGKRPSLSGPLSDSSFKQSLGRTQVPRNSLNRPGQNKSTPKPIKPQATTGFTSPTLSVSLSDASTIPLVLEDEDLIHANDLHSSGLMDSLNTPSPISKHGDQLKHSGLTHRASLAEPKRRSSGLSRESRLKSHSTIEDMNTDTNKQRDMNKQIELSMENQFGDGVDKTQNIERSCTSNEESEYQVLNEKLSCEAENDSGQTIELNIDQKIIESYQTKNQAGKQPNNGCVEVNTIPHYTASSSTTNQTAPNQEQTIDNPVKSDQNQSNISPNTLGYTDSKISDVNIIRNLPGGSFVSNENNLFATDTQLLDSNTCRQDLIKTFHKIDANQQPSQLQSKDIDIYPHAKSEVTQRQALVQSSNSSDTIELQFDAQDVDTLEPQSSSEQLSIQNLQRSDFNTSTSESSGSNQQIGGTQQTNRTSSASSSEQSQSEESSYSADKSDTSKSDQSVQSQEHEDQKPQQHSHKTQQQSTNQTDDIDLSLPNAIQSAEPQQVLEVQDLRHERVPTKLLSRKLKQAINSIEDLKSQVAEQQLPHRSNSLKEGSISNNNISFNTSPGIGQGNNPAVLIHQLNDSDTLSNNGTYSSGCTNPQSPLLDSQIQCTEQHMTGGQDVDPLPMSWPRQNLLESSDSKPSNLSRQTNQEDANKQQNSNLSGFKQGGGLEQQCSAIEDANATGSWSEILQSPLSTTPSIQQKSPKFKQPVHYHVDWGAIDATSMLDSTASSIHANTSNYPTKPLAQTCQITPSRQSETKQTQQQLEQVDGDTSQMVQEAEDIVQGSFKSEAKVVQNLDDQPSTQQATNSWAQQQHNEQQDQYLSQQPLQIEKGYQKLGIDTTDVQTNDQEHNQTTTAQTKTYTSPTARQSFRPDNYSSLYFHQKQQAITTRKKVRPPFLVTDLLHHLRSTDPTSNIVQAIRKYTGHNSQAFSSPTQLNQAQRSVSYDTQMQRPKDLGELLRETQHTRRATISSLATQRHVQTSKDAVPELRTTARANSFITDAEKQVINQLRQIVVKQMVVGDSGLDLSVEQLASSVALSSQGDVGQKQRTNKQSKTLPAPQIIMNSQKLSRSASARSASLSPRRDILVANSTYKQLHKFQRGKGNSSSQSLQEFNTSKQLNLDNIPVSERLYAQRKPRPRSNSLNSLTKVQIEQDQSRLSPLRSSSRLNAQSKQSRSPSPGKKSLPASKGKRAGVDITTEDSGVSLEQIDLEIEKEKLSILELLEGSSIDGHAVKEQVRTALLDSSDNSGGNLSNTIDIGELQRNHSDSLKPQQAQTPQVRNLKSRHIFRNKGRRMSLEQPEHGDKNSDEMVAYIVGQFGSVDDVEPDLDLDCRPEQPKHRLSIVEQSIGAVELDQENRARQASVDEAHVAKQTEVKQGEQDSVDQGDNSYKRKSPKQTQPGRMKLRVSSQSPRLVRQTSNKMLSKSSSRSPKQKSPPKSDNTQSPSSSPTSKKKQVKSPKRGSPTSPKQKQVPGMDWTPRYPKSPKSNSCVDAQDTTHCQSSIYSQGSKYPYYDTSGSSSNVLLVQDNSEQFDDKYIKEQAIIVARLSDSLGCGTGQSSDMHDDSEFFDCKERHSNESQINKQPSIQSDKVNQLQKEKSQQTVYSTASKSDFSDGETLKCDTQTHHLENIAGLQIETDLKQISQEDSDVGGQKSSGQSTGQVQDEAEQNQPGSCLMAKEQPNLEEPDQVLQVLEDGPNMADLVPSEQLVDTQREQEQSKVDQPGLDLVAQQTIEPSEQEDQEHRNPVKTGQKPLKQKKGLFQCCFKA